MIFYHIFKWTLFVTFCACLYAGMYALINVINSRPLWIEIPTVLGLIWTNIAGLWVLLWIFAKELMPDEEETES